MNQESGGDWAHTLGVPFVFTVGSFRWRCGLRASERGVIRASFRAETAADRDGGGSPRGPGIGVVAGTPSMPRVVVWGLRAVPSVPESSPNELVKGGDQHESTKELNKTIDLHESTKGVDQGT